MVRPGLAQTQAVLARELTGGTDEASRLFRQSVTLTRQAERARIELARLQDLAKPSPQEVVRARASSDPRSLPEGTADDPGGASSFPRFRAVSSDTIPLSDLQKILKNGEAYYRMTIVGDHVYGMLITPTSAHAEKLKATQTDR
jgi:hypothetical protein